MRRSHRPGMLGLLVMEYLGGPRGLEDHACLTGFEVLGGPVTLADRLLGFGGRCLPFRVLCLEYLAGQMGL
jgi:hypothetical protein